MSNSENEGRLSRRDFIKKTALNTGKIIGVGIGGVAIGAGLSKAPEISDAVASAVEPKAAKAQTTKRTFLPVSPDTSSFENGTVIQTPLEKLVSEAALTEPAVIGEWNSKQAVLEFRRTAGSQDTINMSPQFKQASANFIARNFNDPETDSLTRGKKKLVVLVIENRAADPNATFFEAEGITLLVRHLDIDGKKHNMGYHGFAQTNDTILIGFAPPYGGINYEEVIIPGNGYKFADVFKSSMGTNLSYASILGRDGSNFQMTDNQVSTMSQQRPTFRELTQISPRSS